MSLPKVFGSHDSIQDVSGRFSWREGEEGLSNVRVTR